MIVFSILGYLFKTLFRVIEDFYLLKNAEIVRWNSYKSIYVVGAISRAVAYLIFKYFKMANNSNVQGISLRTL